MTAKRESFYSDDGHLTKRGVQVTKPFLMILAKTFCKAKTPREAMDLERVIRGDVSIACSLRILHFQCRKIKGKGKGK